MVDEQIKTEGAKPQETANNPKEGIQSQSYELLERARAEREGLIKENERLEKNLKELRELEASRLLGGTAGGRVETPQMTEAELKKKQAVDFWKGTSIADAIDKYG